MNESLFNSFDIAYSVLDSTPLDWDLNRWEQTLLTNRSDTFRTNITQNKINYTDGTNREFIDKSTFDSCSGIPRSMWVTITKLGEESPTKPSNGTQLPDIDLTFFNHQGKP